MPDLTARHALPIPLDAEIADGEAGFRALATRLDAVIPLTSSGLVYGKHTAAKVANGVYRVTHGMGRKPNAVIPHYGVGGTGDSLLVQWMSHSEDYVTSTTYYFLTCKYTSGSLFTGSSVNVIWIGW